jgi:hypothetical protein
MRFPLYVDRLFRFTYSLAATLTSRFLRTLAHEYMNPIVYSVTSCGGYRGMLGQPECRVLAEALGATIKVW